MLDWGYRIQFPHLLILDGTFSEDIITTGMFLRDLDSCKSRNLILFFNIIKQKNIQAVKDIPWWPWSNLICYIGNLENMTTKMSEGIFFKKNCLKIHIIFISEIRSYPFKLFPKRWKGKIKSIVHNLTKFCDVFIWYGRIQRNWS